MTVALGQIDLPPFTAATLVQSISFPSSTGLFA